MSICIYLFREGLAQVADQGEPGRPRGGQAGPASPDPPSSSRRRPVLGLALLQVGDHELVGAVPPERAALVGQLEISAAPRRATGKQEEQKTQQAERSEGEPFYCSKPATGRERAAELGLLPSRRGSGGRKAPENVQTEASVERCASAKIDESLHDT